jgi:hypothetical protein
MPLLLHLLIDKTQMFVICIYSQILDTRLHSSVTNQHQAVQL